MGAFYAFFLLWTLCASLLNALRLTSYVIKFCDYYFAFCVPLLPCRRVPMSTTESSTESMVSNGAHICGVFFVACLLGVSAICQCFLLVVFCCLFFVHHFSMYIGLVVCLPLLGKDTTLISFLDFTSYFL